VYPWCFVANSCCTRKHPHSGGFSDASRHVAARRGFNCRGPPVSSPRRCASARDSRADIRAEPQGRGDAGAPGERAPSLRLPAQVAHCASQRKRTLLKLNDALCPARACSVPRSLIHLSNTGRNLGISGQCVLKRPVSNIAQGLPVGCELSFEATCLPCDLNEDADLNELGMRVDAEPYGSVGRTISPVSPVRATPTRKRRHRRGPIRAVRTVCA